ncbi:flagellar hook-length control protein FliK [Sphingomonas sp. LY54]|uniref:flagellar hook-length control protein FliK n=1 Tax=Sphingomonas sp. LY54 TaxID=3095343 RepID=UPI002D7A0049|nr:flagellar hook-length control protein FliK [Sphingomonas sp. LY54]WRP28317.1 flagellar hook-length control protein FliK [Sphingomonas sp. LY54]
MMPTVPTFSLLDSMLDMTVKAVPEGAGEGDAFAKLIAGLETAEGEVPTLQVATVGAEPETLIQAGLALATLPAAGEAPAGETRPARVLEPEEAEQPENVLEDLGLPPLLTLQLVQAQPVPAAAKTKAPISVDFTVETSLPAPTTQALIAATAPQLQEMVAAKPGEAIQLRPELLLPRTAGKDQPKIAEASPEATVEAAPELPLVAALQRTLAEALPGFAAPQTAPVEAAPASASAPATLNPADQVIEQQLDLAQESEWLDRLAKDIARTAGGEGSLRFKLNPENLGSLHIEMTQGAAGASVRMTADTEAARAIIADAQPRLIAEARAQGVRISEAHVDLGGGGQPQGGDPRGQRESLQENYLTGFKPSLADAGPAPVSARQGAERYA